MNTPSSLRARTDWSQARLAEALGIAQTTVSDVELGKQDIPEKVASKWATLLGVPAKRFVSAVKAIQEVNTFVADAEGMSKVATKASADDALKIAGHMQRYARNPVIPDTLRKRAVKVSEALAAGPTGSLVRPSGSSLDQFVDPQGRPVKRDGQGNFWVIDESTVPPTISPLQFGDLVQQAGTPTATAAKVTMRMEAGSKSATKSKEQRYAGSGSQRKRMRKE